MIDQDAVIFEEELNGETVKLTVAHVLNHPKASDILHGGCKRVINSAKQGAGEDVNKEDAGRERAIMIRDGVAWRSGGGNMLSEPERQYRNLLAGYAVTYANLKRGDAESRAGKDRDGLLSVTAEAMIRQRENKKPGKDRVAQGVEKLDARIRQEVARLLSDDVTAEI